MAKIYDISGKLQNEPKFIFIDEKHQYKVDDRKNTVLKAMQIIDSGNNTVKEMDELLKIVLGAEAAKEIDKMEVSFDGYLTIIKTVMSAISNVSMEEIDKRFQN